MTLFFFSGLGLRLYFTNYYYEYAKFSKILAIFRILLTLSIKNIFIHNDYVFLLLKVVIDMPIYIISKKPISSPFIGTADELMNRDRILRLTI